MHPVQEFIQFCDHVRASDDHDCWSMTWLDTVRDGPSLVLRLAVDTGLNERPNQIWEVGSHHIRGFSLAEFELTDWTLANDHVLLWDHQEAFSQLNFIAPCKRHETSCGSSMSVIARSRGRGSRSSDTSIRRFWRAACPRGVGSWRTGPIACFASTPTFSGSAISSPTFPIRRGRPIGGTKKIAAGSMSKTSCRFWSSEALPTLWGPIFLLVEWDKEKRKGEEYE